MSVIERIPLNNRASRVRYPPLRFSAPFDAGKYDFDQPGNTDVLLMELASNSLYLITAFSFFANVSESTWLEGMDTKLNFPAYRFKFKFNKSPSILPDPVQCVNYTDNAEQLVYFDSGRSGDQLLISFSGIVNQAAGSVGVDPLLAAINFTMYQITDEAFIRQYRGAVEKRGGNNVMS